MKKSWSRGWNASTQTRKQRKYRANAPLHARTRMLSAHMCAELRKQYGRRSFPVRVGDEVTVKRGEFSGKTGKITEVDMKKLKIYIENAKRKMASGQEKTAAIDPSNTVIMKLTLDDKERLKSLSKKTNAVGAARG